MEGEERRLVWSGRGADVSELSCGTPNGAELKMRQGWSNEGPGWRGGGWRIEIKFKHFSWSGTYGWPGELMFKGGKKVSRAAGCLFLLRSQWTVKALGECHSVQKQLWDNGGVSILALSWITRKNLRREKKNKRIWYLMFAFIVFGKLFIILLPYDFL